MKVLSIVGARPQFIKAAPVSRALRERHTEVLVHTGQHYDYAMSEVFFEELGIPAPDVNLAVGSGSHGEQTAEMLVAIERLLVAERPDCVLVYGDTNTTLAGGLAAAKLTIPVAHVEAGLRSFDRTMPEEVNRVLVDHLSDLLLCPTTTAVKNLADEGVTAGVELVGDVMLDTARFNAERWDAGAVLDSFGVEPGAYFLATVHRASNADSPEHLGSIVDALSALDKPVIWPVHPRTAKNLAAFGLDARIAAAGTIRAVTPISYREMVGLLSNAAALLTDSGGMQKEAYFFGIPCVTMRDETEWVETVESGWNVLVGADATAIVEAVRGRTIPSERPEVYGTGHAADAVVAALERHDFG
ncbi:MAG: UDP-N-acetylglucosamine 2-epimerase (non-hydrolyzing) [Coriobacteriia bacterium]|nr:UDP-N-acetylglucosamine 2-epimerase (non-hydrolyzing) [Coriobacteriia bacterium]